MAISGFYLLPHPPILIPEVGRGEEEKLSETTASFQLVAKEIKESSPDVLILITPHGTMFQDAISISYGSHLEGSLKDFGAEKVQLSFSIDRELSEEIYRQAEKDGISTVLSTREMLQEFSAPFSLDHGALVPLHMLNFKEFTPLLVHITYAPFSDVDLYRFGMAIQKAVKLVNRSAVLVASGDLSHKLMEKGPYSYHPSGPIFDRSFLDALVTGKTEDIFSMEKSLIQEAGECGRRSALILLGALDGYSYVGTALSYQGPFGVGYGVVSIQPKEIMPSFLPILEEMLEKEYQNRLCSQDEYVQLARKSLTYYLTHQKKLPLPENLSAQLTQERKGVFVSLKKNGELRGCIGTISPTKENLALEIISNAVEAGEYDPRFYPVTKEELREIVFSVDVLEPASPCTIQMLDPKKYGVIVESNGKRGLLLPDLEGVDTVEKQLDIAKQKAGISSKESVQLFRFLVTRHGEK